MIEKNLCQRPRVLGVTDSRINFQPTVADLFYCDRLIQVTTTVGNGASGCPHLTEDVNCEEFIQRHDDPAYRPHSCLQIALADALMASFASDTPPAKTLVGSPESKAQQRADFLMDIAHQLAPQVLRTKKPGHIALIGAVGSIIESLNERGYDVTVTDMDTMLIGQELAGTTVASGASTAQAVEKADLAIVTGMVLATETLGAVLKAAHNGATPILFFAQSGAHILSSMTFPTATAIVAESFPFYMWPGATSVHVHYPIVSKVAN